MVAVVVIVCGNELVVDNKHQEGCKADSKAWCQVALVNLQSQIGHERERAWQGPDELGAAKVCSSTWRSCDTASHVDTPHWQHHAKL